MGGAGTPHPSSKLIGSDRVSLLRERGAFVMSVAEADSTPSQFPPAVGLGDFSHSQGQVVSEFDRLVDQSRETVRSMGFLKFHSQLLCLRLSGHLTALAHWIARP